jgi:hypothetical protein
MQAEHASYTTQFGSRHGSASFRLSKLSFPGSSLFSLLRATPRWPGTASLLRGRNGRVPSRATFSAHAVAQRTAVVRRRLLACFCARPGFFPQGRFVAMFTCFFGACRTTGASEPLAFRANRPRTKKRNKNENEKKEENERRSNERRKFRRRRPPRAAAGPLAR